MFIFFGNVMLVLIVYLFINKNLFYGIFMLKKDMFWVYWKKGVLVFWYCLKVL